MNFSPEQRSVLARGVVLALMCLLLWLSGAGAGFATLGNGLNILRQASLLFLLASGLTLVILCGGLDLSVGANVALSACLCAQVMQGQDSIALGCLVGVACGAGIGLLNATLVTALRIPPFIATYGTLWILHGLTYWVMKGETLHGFAPGFRALGSGYLGGVPVPIYLMLLILGLGSWLLQYTVWGQEIYATGANAEAAGLSGVPVARRRVGVYLVSGIMCGLAALVYLARLNSAEGDMGESLTLQAIAAVLIGGTSLFGGTGSLMGTLLGALILTVVLNGMNQLGVSANWQPLITGVIVIVSVMSDAIVRRHRMS